MNHTPEPWTTSWESLAGTAVEAAGKSILFCYSHEGNQAGGQKIDHHENARRLVVCVNACAGLNPSAYRECVEALKGLLPYYEASAVGNDQFLKLERAKHALALTQGTQ